MTSALFTTGADVTSEHETRLTERDMLDLLHARYAATSMEVRRWVVAEHVHERPGVADGQRIADFIAIDCYGSGPWVWGKDRRHNVHGHEVKVSRSDWLTELRDPSKAAAWMRYCHYWWLVAASTDVYRRDEIPEGWGVMTRGSAGLRVRIRAPYRDAEPLRPATVAAFARAVSKAGAA